MTSSHSDIKKKIKQFFLSRFSSQNLKLIPSSKTYWPRKFWITIDTNLFFTRGDFKTYPISTSRIIFKDTRKCFLRTFFTHYNSQFQKSSNDHPEENISESYNRKILHTALDCVGNRNSIQWLIPSTDRKLIENFSPRDGQTHSTRTLQHYIE